MRGEHFKALTSEQRAALRPYVKPERPTGPKCARCWDHLEDVGSVFGFPDLCPRCADAVQQWAARRFDAAYCAALDRGATKAEAEAEAMQACPCPATP